MKISDIRTYKIEIHDRVEEEDINRFSPLRVKIEHVGEPNTVITFQGDQSGMIGLIRHLHNLGMVLQSIHCDIANLPRQSQCDALEYGTGSRGD